MAERRIQNAGSAWAGGSIRASDAEREQVVTALQQHYVDGRITDEELDERVGYLLKTRTRGALVEVTRDLPSLDRPAAAPAAKPHHHDSRRHHDRRRRRVPVAEIAFALLGVLLLLPGLAVVVLTGERGWDGPPFPPLLAIFLVWMAVRLATRSRWR